MNIKIKNNKILKKYTRYDYSNETKLIIKILNDKFENLNNTEKLDYLKECWNDERVNKTMNELVKSIFNIYETPVREVIKHILLVADDIVNKKYDVERLNQRLTVVANLNTNLTEWDKGNSEDDIQDTFTLENIGDMKLKDAIILIHSKLSFNIALILVLLF